MIKWHLNKNHTLALLLAFGFWLVGDLVTTWAILRIGLIEVNPFFSWLTIETLWILITIKLSTTLSIFFLLNLWELRTKFCDYLIHRKIIPKIFIAYIFGMGFSVTMLNFIELSLEAGLI